MCIYNCQNVSSLVGTSVDLQWPGCFHICLERYIFVGIMNHFLLSAVIHNLRQAAVTIPTCLMRILWLSDDDDSLVR